MTKQTTNTETVAKAGLVQSLRNKPTTKWLLIAVIALIVFIGGYFAFRKFYTEPRDNKNQTFLLEGIGLLNQGRQAQSQYAQMEILPDSSLAQVLISQGVISETTPDSISIAVKEARQRVQAQVNDLFNKALKGDGKFPGFLRIAKDGGKSGNVAYYLAGTVYFNMSQYKEAIKQLEEFSPMSDNSISPLVISMLANAYACDKQIEKAIETFKKAAKLADNEAMTPKFLLEAGKLLESLNKKGEANKIYLQIKKEYPQFGQTQGGMMSSEIDKYIERTK